MLVYYKVPNGVLHLPNGKRIYGRLRCKSPKDVSAEEYKKYRNMFVDATYRKGDLSRASGMRIQDDLAINMQTIKEMPMHYLTQVAAAMGLMKFHRGSSRVQIYQRIMKKLMDASPNA